MSEQLSKYLTFQLNQENYAIPILKIKEIIGMMPITQVPRLPDFIKGVINLRGKIIPVMDLRLKFGLESRPYDERTSIVVMELESDNGKRTSGMVVDAVDEVLDIPEENIAPPPQYGAAVDQAFLQGMGMIGECVIMLLNVDKVLSTGEMQALESANKGKVTS